MKIRFGVVFILLTALCVLCPPAAGASSTLEEIVERSMSDALHEEGIGDLIAGRISARYVFMGSVMINKIQFDDGEALFNQAQLTGRALGAALAASYMQYGVDALQETASVMMLSARAGVTPEAAADTFTALARNGYALDASVEIMRETAETVRALKSNDGAAAICTKISSMAAAQAPIGELRGEILSIAKREKDRQRQLIAMQEAERRKRENQGGGGEGSASASRGGGNEGGSSSEGASGSGGSGGSSGGASAAGAGGGDSSEGGSGAAGGASGSDSSAGSSGSSSGGSDSSSGSNGGSDAGGAEGTGDSGTDSSGSSGANDASDSNSSGGQGDQTAQ